MVKCKFCGQGVRVAPVFHPACWVQAAGKAAEVFCDDYCRYPRELDQEKLLEQCMECPLVRLTALGGEV